MPLDPLPIDEVLPQLIGALRQSACCVLRAPTGAGKTTRTPPALYEAGLARRILVLQPRRVAARAAARRMAAERGWRLGTQVGYHVRFDKQARADTPVVVMTEGVLLRLLQEDPFLEQADCVILDEFHERSLASETALGMLRRIRQEVRPELKLLVMSATLDAAPIARFLDDCPVVESQGRLHPVTVEHHWELRRRSVDQLAAEGVQRALDRTAGDLLVFLPGVGEIRKTARRLEPLAARRGLAVMALYGDLPPARQDAVLAPSDRRKVVLATNVAETSVTIPGVTAVVDTGLAKILRFDPAVGLDRLQLAPISRASAEQRAGRAGRTGPGFCLRLWDPRFDRQRPAFDEPEIRRVDLTGAVLQLAAWGEPDPLDFPWFEPPRAESLERAAALLEELGAIREGRITPLGRALARLPLHPRLGRLLIEGARLGCLPQAALAAALLSERDPLLAARKAAGRRQRRGAWAAPASWRQSDSDVADRVAALEAFRDTGRRDTDAGELAPGPARFVLQAARQLEREARRLNKAPGASEAGAAETHGASEANNAAGQVRQRLLQAVWTAYADRLARRRPGRSDKGVMVGGRGVRLDPTCCVRSGELFVCVDVDAGRGEAVVRQASLVRREWLPQDRLRTEDEVVFDERHNQVAARRRLYWRDLLLQQTPTSTADSPEAARLLLEKAAAQWERVFPADDPRLAAFLGRVDFLRRWRPELQLPAPDRPWLLETLRPLCAQCRSFAELREADWVGQLKRQLTPEQRAALERDAPERIATPGGPRVAVRYAVGKTPTLPVRIQDAFGWREAPRLAGGRAPLLLELLAPNMRPQQITSDLASFWKNTYPVVRNELRRRYPKHAWPERPP